MLKTALRPVVVCAISPSPCAQVGLCYALSFKLCIITSVEAKLDLNTAAREPSPARIELSIAVPCYNEAGGLDELLRRLAAACAAAGVARYEIILVNDGSADGTWPLIAERARRDARIVGIDLSRNFGHQLALTAALAACRGERVFILDADLQDPPELLPTMMERMDEGADVVYGKRRARPGE